MSRNMMLPPYSQGKCPAAGEQLHFKNRKTLTRSSHNVFLLYNKFVSKFISTCIYLPDNYYYTIFITFLQHLCKLLWVLLKHLLFYNPNFVSFNTKLVFYYFLYHISLGICKFFIYFNYNIVFIFVWNNYYFCYTFSFNDPLNYIY